MDFYCEELRLAIECDGSYWHSRPWNIAKDKTREEFMRKQQIRVVHLGEQEIHNDPDGCATKIIDAIVAAINH